MSRQERRKAKTRRQLQDAVLEVLQEKHHSDITVKDVVEQADLGRTTFYLHFTDINDLLASCAERVIDDMTEHLNPDMLASPENIQAFGEKLFAHMQENRDLFRLLLGEDGLPLVIHRFHQYNAEVIAEHLATVPEMQGRQADIPIIANMLSGARLGMHFWILKENATPEPEEFISHFQRMLHIVKHSWQE